LLKKSNSLF